MTESLCGNKRLTTSARSLGGNLPSYNISHRKWDVLFARKFVKCQVRWEDELTLTGSVRRSYCACVARNGAPAGRHNDPLRPEQPSLLPYSEDIAYAWEAVSQMKPDHLAFWRRNAVRWECHLWFGRVKGEAFGRTPAAALVRCALKCVGWTEENIRYVDLR